MAKKGWKEIPIGGLIDKGGSAKEYNTGAWRTFKPVVDQEKCISCGACVSACKHNAISLE